MSDDDKTSGSGFVFEHFLKRGQPDRSRDVRYRRRDLKTHFGDLTKGLYISRPTTVHALIPLLQYHWKAKIGTNDLVNSIIGEDAVVITLKATRYSKYWKGETRLNIITREVDTAVSLHSIIHTKSLSGLDFIPPQRIVIVDLGGLVFNNPDDSDSGGSGFGGLFN